MLCSLRKFYADLCDTTAFQKFCQRYLCTSKHTIALSFQNFCQQTTGSALVHCISSDLKIVLGVMRLISPPPSPPLSLPLCISLVLSLSLSLSLARSLALSLSRSLSLSLSLSLSRSLALLSRALSLFLTHFFSHRQSSRRVRQPWQRQLWEHRRKQEPPFRHTAGSWEHAPRPVG